MKLAEVNPLADWLTEQQEAILNREVKLDVDQIEAAIDTLHVFEKPVKDYLDLDQEKYYETESDHKFTLLAGKSKVSEIEDRIMINHVDGFLRKDEINFTYNHEKVFDNGYSAKKDLQVLRYGMKVVGAVAATGDQEAVEKLSKDSLISLALSANAIAAWQDQ